MSDSDSRPDVNEQAVEEMAQQIASDVANGQHYLAGDGNALVALALDVDNASTPEEAVLMAVMNIANRGFDGFFFQVTDKTTGTMYFVRAGEVFEAREPETGEPA